ncbi:MAG: peptidoglycan-binding protein [Clostridia bacterium]|nr:peptidoglycan-binding protein [Clostridia bacterium]
MHTIKKIALWLILTALAFVLCACGPDEDTTDELIASNIDVPFNTTGLLTTPRPIQVTGWFGESVTLYEDEYSVLTLQEPSIGDNVRTLQRRLIELNYLSSEKNTKGEYKRVNGKFDAATEQAVEKFEAAYGQSPTGIATELMQHYLFSEDAKSYYTSTASNTPTPTPTPSKFPTATGYRYLQRGDSGEDVTALQQRLYDLGYLNYVSGSYDTATESAVSQFASAYGQYTNGNATVELQRTLYSANARSYQQMLASITPTPSPTPTPDPYGGYQTLSQGDRGQAVTNLQKRLRALGYMRSTADGLYGERTVEAVMAFEAAYGRPQTGIATAALQSVLFSDDALRYGTVTPTPVFTATPEPVYSYTTLTYGSSGEAVLRLQMRLIQLGYLSGSADGMFGEMTANAIKAFETANGKTPTGVATSALQLYLFSDSAQPAPVQPTATPNGYGDLSLGSSGQAVVNLQNRLFQLGYYAGMSTGYYDSATAEAVQRFEVAYGRTPTGVATSALQQYLYSDSARPNVTATPTATPYVPSYPTLQRGDKGDEVERLQARLVELGYLSGTVDGYFGEGTALAVSYFEAVYGRTPTGIATSELQANLYSSSARYNTSGNIAVSYSTLKSGDSGTAVRNLQSRLIQLGFMSGTASGTYDNRTLNAVKSFQHAMELTVNGTASSDLQQKLFSASAKDYSAEKVVNVNKPGQVKAASTGVYTSFYDERPAVTLSRGTALTVIRTRGIWAEVKNANGNIGYVMLSDIEYTSDTPTPTPAGPSRVVVNKAAYISAGSATVYESASTSSKKLGTLNQNQALVWVATIGDWAEIRNDKGTVTGYVKVSQLALGTPQTVTPTPAPSAYGYTTFHKGDKGDDVKSLQARLKELGYHYADVGGNYLDKTMASVKRFQLEIGITADGVATPGLQDLIFCPYAPKYDGAKRTENKYTDMYSGRSDADVSKLQRCLVQLGYLSNASGSYDSATIKAVKQVQSALGLRDNSGLATRELQAFLYTFGGLLKE